MAGESLRSAVLLWAAGAVVAAAATALPGVGCQARAKGKAAKAESATGVWRGSGAFGRGDYFQRVCSLVEPNAQRTDSKNAVAAIWVIKEKQQCCDWY